MLEFIKMYLSPELILLILVSFAFLIYYVRIQWKKRTITKKQNRGREKETEAGRLLEKGGYKVLEYQPEYYYELKEDGETIKIKLQPDYVVQKRRRTYIAEVKTGEATKGVRHNSTRRQILEYRTYIPNDGILLVDMDKKEIREVEFP